MSDGVVTVSKHDLTAFCEDVFTGLGVPDEDARVWAEVLVWANLRGVDSHGVLRIPNYVDHIDEHMINVQPHLNFDLQAGAVSRLDADLAPGPVALAAAMDAAIEQAREVHVGWCVIRNMTHAGAVGYFALQAARAGMAGIVMSASQPMMAYPGARVPAVSTNPVAIAVPGEAHAPLLLDMSTSTVSMGKVLRARDGNDEIPLDWGLDAQGKPTNDPHAVAMLSPLGGAKGAGLSLMIECLTSLAVGLPLIAPVLESGRRHHGRPINGLAAAIDISVFGDGAGYRDNVDAIARAITGLPKSDEVERIFAPGERGDAVMAERLDQGIPLPAGTVARLKPVAARLGLTVPGDRAPGAPPRPEPRA